MSSSNAIAAEVYYRDKSLLQCHVAYEGFFGLKENPFSLTPDPRYLFRTRHAHETLRQLTRAILTRRGLILLSGEVGTGKTTLLNTALQVLKANPEVGTKTRTAVLVHPTLTREELVEAILNDFNFPCTATRKPRRLQVLREMLLEVRRKGGAAVLAVDEAQLLTHELLDEIRVLLSLRSGQEELLQIVLCGQPEIEEKLTRSALCRLPPPVTVRCKTAPLTLQDTHDYIAHRLKVAGAKSDSIFTRDAADAVHRYSRGIPRVVNLICAHALSTAGLRGVRHITSQMIEEAAAKMPFLDGKPPAPRSRGLHSGNAAPPKPPASQSAPNQGETCTLGSAAQMMQRESHNPRRPPAPAIGVEDHVSRVQPILPAILPRTPWSNRWWRVDFAQKKYWMLLCNMALIGALFLTLAQNAGSASAWQHAARAALGFSSLLLLDVSLGLAAYLFLFERRARLRTNATARFWASYKHLCGKVRTRLQFTQRNEGAGRKFWRFKPTLADPACPDGGGEARTGAEAGFFSSSPRLFKRLSGLLFLASLRLARLGPRDPTRRP